MTYATMFHKRIDLQAIREIVGVYWVVVQFDVEAALRRHLARQTCRQHQTVPLPFCGNWRSLKLENNVRYPR